MEEDLLEVVQFREYAVNGCAGAAGNGEDEPLMVRSHHLWRMAQCSIVAL